MDDDGEKNQQQKKVEDPVSSDKKEERSSGEPAAPPRSGDGPEKEITKAQPKSVLDREAEKGRRRQAEVEKEQLQEDQITKESYTYFKSEDVALLRKEVVIHPIPLLSITDHYTRSAMGTNRRVVGCLLGEMIEGKVHITNSFGVPFEENPRDLSVWFVDQQYLNKMYRMFKKINAREHIIGWYSTAGYLKANDSVIHELFRKYHRHPIFLVLDVLAKNSVENQDAANPNNAGIDGGLIPGATSLKKADSSTNIVQTYYSFEQPNTGDERRVFLHTPYVLGTSEAEQVGVEHLLKDTNTNLDATLGSAITNKLDALKAAATKLEEITDYLRQVASGDLPVRPHIMAQLQNLLNSLPDKSDPQMLARGFQKYTNDALFSSYIGYATRTVLAIHDLTLNRKQLKENQVATSAAAAPTT